MKKINDAVIDNHAVISTGAVERYLRRLFIFYAMIVKLNFKNYRGDFVTSSSAANKSPLENSFQASTGHKNPEFIIVKATGTLIIISSSKEFDVVLA